MKNHFVRLVMMGAAILLAGCAGMPNLPNMPSGRGGLSSLIPGSSGSDTMGSLASLAKDAKDAFSDIPESEEIEMGEVVAAGMLGAAPLLKDSAFSGTSIGWADGWRCTRSGPTCPGGLQ